MGAYAGGRSNRRRHRRICRGAGGRCGGRRLRCRHGFGGCIVFAEHAALGTVTGAMLRRHHGHQISMAEKKAKKKPGAPRKRRKLAGKSIGLEARELLTTAMPSNVAELQTAIEEDGGRVLTSYREPFSGHWLIMAALPIEKVEPTPYQRNLSDNHARKLESVIAKLGRFLDPVIIVRKETKDSETRYWTPNGNHRLSAMRTLGAKSIVGIIVP